jgi:GNAT superfamily N-acetyltransferase
VSCWCNESREQTLEIAKSYTQQRERLSREDLGAWHMVHRLLRRRVGTKVIFPKWFQEIAERLFVDDLRVRRYYPAFVEANRTVCLIRSFQPDRKLSKHGQIEVEFADFAITALIFDSVFVESLHLGKGVGEITRRLVEAISVAKGRPVHAKDIARKLRISMDQAYSKLRYADKVGVIRRANKPEKSNPKAYLSTPPPRFVPEPEKLFRKLRDLDDTVRFVHPITGDWVTYRRKA